MEPTPMQAKPFRIHVEQEVLDDLETRLQRVRWSGAANNSTWDYGTNGTYLQELVHYWRTNYDWRHHELLLNKLPQFVAHIDNADMHFVHVKARATKAMPLLLLHGWPDSFYRFYKVIPGFSDPTLRGGNPADSFDVIVPSLPGFPFTGTVNRAGHQRPTRHSAQLIWRLMTEVLGYKQFAIAGGDGGSVIAQILAIDHPDDVIGVHLTDLGWHASNVDESTVTKPEQAYLKQSKKKFLADGAYAMVQGTKPRSLAAGLNDSPVGLASWILDRFHSWSDNNGDLERSFSKDELLTNIMLYWVTQTIGSSIFNYYADGQSPSLTTADYVHRPVGMALFPKDAGGVPPRSFAERTLNVQRWTEMSRGSHFAALEEPNLYSNDVVEFFRTLR